mmetsp:Transcript_21281/g.46397  ORF Transcript_21281/g.46397 Transcript_21281/m.46397 type:complete len:257 (-) Transcript_21281:58-828(-)
MNIAIVHIRPMNSAGGKGIISRRYPHLLQIDPCAERTVVGYLGLCRIQHLANGAITGWVPGRTNTCSALLRTALTFLLGLVIGDFVLILVLVLLAKRYPYSIIFRSGRIIVIGAHDNDIAVVVDIKLNDVGFVTYSLLVIRRSLKDVDGFLRSPQHILFSSALSISARCASWRRRCYSCCAANLASRARRSAASRCDRSAVGLPARARAPPAPWPFWFRLPFGRGMIDVAVRSCISSTAVGRELLPSALLDCSYYR